MATLLAEHRGRRAAHGRHVCQICRRRIAAGERYLDQRIADSGTCYTFRAHLACDSAYWSWGPDEDDFVSLADMSSGHLPPCQMAWAANEDLVGPCVCGLEP